MLFNVCIEGVIVLILLNDTLSALIMSCGQERIRTINLEEVPWKIFQCRRDDRGRNRVMGFGTAFFRPFSPCPRFYYYLQLWAFNHTVKFGCYAHSPWLHVGRQGRATVIVPSGCGSLWRTRTLKTLKRSITHQTV